MLVGNETGIPMFFLEDPAADIDTKQTHSFKKASGDINITPG